MVRKRKILQVIVRLALVLSLSFLLCVTCSTLGTQTGQQVIKSDPPEDQEGPNYLDVLSVKLTRIGDELTFEFNTAAVIPDSPDYPYTAYIFRIDFDVGGSFTPKYHVRIFNGSRTEGWRGTVRVRQDKKELKVIPASISGRTGRIVVNIPELSSSTKFEWLLNTFASPDHGRITGDRIPDIGNYVFSASENQEVKLKGTITSFSRTDSTPALTVQIEEVLLGPLSIERSILVEWLAPLVFCPSAGAAPIDDVSQGDKVEVYGELTDSGVKVTCLPTYIKKISQNFQVQIIKKITEDEEEGVKGVVKIPFKYNLPEGIISIPKQIKGRGYVVKVDDKVVLDNHTHWNEKARPPVIVKGLFNQEELKLYNNKRKAKCYKNFLNLAYPKILEGVGKDEFYLSSHFFDNGKHEVTFGVYCGTDDSGNSRYCQDKIQLNFQNEYQTKDIHPPSGSFTEMVTFKALDDYRFKEEAEEIVRALNEKAGDENVYIHREAAAEYRFAGDQWICKEEAFRVLEVVDMAGTVYSIFTLGTAATAKEAVKEALKMVGEYVIKSTIKGLAHIYVKDLFEKPGLNYKVFPGGDLEGINGNRRLLLLHFYEPQQAINAFYPGGRIHKDVTWDHIVPAYLNKGSGKWKFLFLKDEDTQEAGKKVGFTSALPEWEGLQWDPGAESIEWIKRPTSIPKGQSKRFKFRVRENVLPNLRGMGMHLALELPKGMEISNVEVHDAIGTEFKSGSERVGDLGYVRKAYETDPDYCGYEMYPASSVEGDGQELGCKTFAKRVLIDIPFVNSYYENVKETVSFVLTNNEIQGSTKVRYGLVPRSYHQCNKRHEVGYNLRATNLERRRHALLTELPVYREVYDFYYPAQLNHSIELSSLPSGEVDFPDSHLEKAIREAIDKPTGNIYQSNLTSLTELDADNSGISDLTGLEHCTGLRVLTMHHNQISDLSPLAGLTHLRGLGLHDNQISDLSPLAGLTHLRMLHLQNNQISDLSPLAGLTHLRTLWLIRNQISNVTPLARLTNLKKLTLSYNQISNVTPFATLTNLTELWLDHNQITSLQALVDNPGLDAYAEIWLQYNYLDLSFGSDDMENLQKLVDRGVGVKYKPQKGT